jgi:hypothetical protein
LQVKPTNDVKAATITSYKITEVLVKMKKPFEDDNLIQEYSVVTDESLLSEFKNKSEICNAIKEALLSRTTVNKLAEYMPDDMQQQSRQDVEICEVFRLQLDE